jgi:hypothetical protein
VDLDDGTLEIIFTTCRSSWRWEEATCILNYRGEVVRKVALPYGDPND